MYMQDEHRDPGSCHNQQIQTDQSYMKTKSQRATNQWQCTCYDMPSPLENAEDAPTLNSRLPKLNPCAAVANKPSQTNASYLYNHYMHSHCSNFLQDRPSQTNDLNKNLQNDFNAMDQIIYPTQQYICRIIDENDECECKDEPNQRDSASSTRDKSSNWRQILLPESRPQYQQTDKCGLSKSQPSFVSAIEPPSCKNATKDNALRYCSAISKSVCHLPCLCPPPPSADLQSLLLSKVESDCPVTSCHAMDVNTKAEGNPTDIPKPGATFSADEFNSVDFKDPQSCNCLDPNRSILPTNTGDAHIGADNFCLATSVAQPAPERVSIEPSKSPTVASQRSSKVEKLDMDKLSSIGRVGEQLSYAPDSQNAPIRYHSVSSDCNLNKMPKPDDLATTRPSKRMDINDMKTEQSKTPCDFNQLDNASTFQSAQQSFYQAAGKREKEITGYNSFKSGTSNLVNDDQNCPGESNLLGVPRSSQQRSSRTGDNREKAISGYNSFKSGTSNQVTGFCDLTDDQSCPCESNPMGIPTGSVNTIITYGKSFDLVANCNVPSAVANWQSPPPSECIADSIVDKMSTKGEKRGDKKPCPPPKAHSQYIKNEDYLEIDPTYSNVLPSEMINRSMQSDRYYNADTSYITTSIKGSKLCQDKEDNARIYENVAPSYHKSSMGYTDKTSSRSQSFMANVTCLCSSIDKMQLCPGREGPPFKRIEDTKVVPSCSVSQSADVVFQNRNEQFSDCYSSSEISLCFCARKSQAASDFKTIPSCGHKTQQSGDGIAGSKAQSTSVCLKCLGPSMSKILSARSKICSHNNLAEAKDSKSCITTSEHGKDTKKICTPFRSISCGKLQTSRFTVCSQKQKERSQQQQQEPPCRQGLDMQQDYNICYECISQDQGWSAPPCKQPNLIQQDLFCECVSEEQTRSVSCVQQLNQMKNKIASECASFQTRWTAPCTQQPSQVRQDVFCECASEEQTWTSPCEQYPDVYCECPSEKISNYRSCISEKCCPGLSNDHVVNIINLLNDVNDCRLERKAVIKQLFRELTQMLRQEEDELQDDKSWCYEECMAAVTAGRIPPCKSPRSKDKVERMQCLEQMEKYVEKCFPDKNKCMPKELKEIVVLQHDPTFDPCPMPCLMDTESSSRSPVCTCVTGTSYITPEPSSDKECDCKSEETKISNFGTCSCKTTTTTTSDRKSVSISIPIEEEVLSKLPEEQTDQEIALEEYSPLFPVQEELSSYISYGEESSKLIPHEESLKIEPFEEGVLPEEEYVCPEEYAERVCPEEEQGECVCPEEEQECACPEEVIGECVCPEEEQGDCVCPDEELVKEPVDLICKEEQSLKGQEECVCKEEQSMKDQGDCVCHEEPLLDGQVECDCPKEQPLKNHGGECVCKEEQSREDRGECVCPQEPLLIRQVDCDCPEEPPLKIQGECVGLPCESTKELTADSGAMEKASCLGETDFDDALSPLTERERLLCEYMMRRMCELCEDDQGLDEELTECIDGPRDPCVCCHCRAVICDNQCQTVSKILDAVPCDPVAETKFFIDSIIYDLHAMHHVLTKNKINPKNAQPSPCMGNAPGDSFPVSITSVSSLGCRALYVRWELEDCAGIGGYEIYVDGHLTNRFYSYRHESGVVANVDVTKRHQIILRAQAVGHEFPGDEPGSPDTKMAHVHPEMLVGSVRPWTPSVFFYEP
ncbi:uncharacterized protein LOC111598626 isoform X2 [Drosophila hydei]|nr:uncharacterized protein LOC111598626 isoform X2 [Drosophila hydei]